MFHTFGQNNSGGSFDFNEDRGITHHVIIEGDSEKDILDKAEMIGIYFNGCATGTDCDCCGDRWHLPYEGDGFDEKPLLYGQDIPEAIKDMWMEKGKEVCIHYKDGRKEWF